MVAELREGFRTLRDVVPAVAFFGSARSKRRSEEYELVRATARTLAGVGFTVIAGGGPSVMEASNRG
jgi:predicted Rossmann-fold nucleotide-binding protein